MTRVWPPSVVNVVLCWSACAMQLAAQEPALRTFSSTPTCSSCSVEFRHHTTLSIPGDSLYFDRLTSLFRLRAGGILLVELGGSRVPAVFDSTGRFVRQIARAGSGPGEIGSLARPVARAPGDSLWIFDGSRKLVFSPDAVFVREERLVNRPGTELLVTDDGTMITASIVGTPDAAGYPLHLRDAGSVIRRSFGVADPILDPRRFAATGDDASIYLHRTLTPVDASTFWAYNESRFLLERYDITGRLIARYRHAPDGWYGEATRVKPSPGEFSGLALHAVLPSGNPDMIWLIYHVPRAEYEPPRSGAPADWQKWIASHDVLVEAFDTRRNEVVATGRLAQTAMRPVRYATGMLALLRGTSEPFVNLELVTLHINRPQSQP